MNDLPRDKYEILDLIFIFLNSLCMSLAAIFLLYNPIVSLIFFIVIVLFVFVVLYFWIARNPFYIYLVRVFMINNLFFTIIALILFSYRLSDTTDYPVGYVLLLIPSGFYLIISFKFSALSTFKDRRAGARLFLIGEIKAAQHLFIKENMEDRKRREELIAKQKKVYRYKIIIILAIALTLSSFAALIFDFY